MIASLQSWWTALSPREKRLILVMLALVAGVMLWLGVVRPVTDGLASATARHLRAQDRYASVAAGVEALRGARPRAAAIGMPVDQFVAQSAADTGFTLDSSNGAGDDSVAIVIGSARAPALFGWLAKLEAQGVGVDSFSAQPGANGTISARITLKVMR